MKTARHCILFIASILILSGGCKKESGTKPEINDFEALNSEFMSPSPEYTTSPFFVWNYKITKEEIDKFMVDFRNAGSKQVFL